MESINVQTSREAGDLIQSLWRDATWAKAEVRSVEQEMVLHLGRGTGGPVIAMRTVGLDGNTARFWNASQTYTGDEHSWLGKKDQHPDAQLQLLRPEKASFDKLSKVRSLLAPHTSIIFSSLG